MATRTQPEIRSLSRIAKSVGEHTQSPSEWRYALMNKRTFCAACISLFLAGLCQAGSKVKIHGYVTARPDPNTVLIMDDVIHLSSSTHFDLQNSSAEGAKSVSLAELSPGTLIEAEGNWTERHQFSAE